MSRHTSVCITIVTYNSRQYIARCLDRVIHQTFQPLDIIVVDNASTDGTQDALKAYEDRAMILYNGGNDGFAAAQNQAIALSESDWVLVLNPDALLEPDFVERLVEAGQSDARVGTVCGKLLSIGRDLAPPAARLIDSAGIYFTPAARHFDRGWREPDDGRYDDPQYVFGASAAAALYRREMIADVASPDGFFDPDFFCYREDADVAWRAQLLGWRCLYTPAAVGHHVRRVVPDNRRGVPAFINMHSVKNRFLLRIKNTTGRLYRRHWLAMTARDAVVLGACVFYEPTSLPALWLLAKALPRALAKRRDIMGRRRVSDEVLADWFQADPATRPVPEPVFR